MKAMKWILGAVVATAILAPLQSANAWNGDGYGRGGYDETRHGDYRGGDDDDGYRGHYRDHRGYYGHHGDYWGHRDYYGRHGDYRGHRDYYGHHGDYGRPWYGYRGPVVVAPPPPRW